MPPSATQPAPLVAGPAGTQSGALQGRVSLQTRFFGDFLLETALVFGTFWIGWLIWFAVVARRGQTPAKQLVGIRVHNRSTGAIASTGKVWLREVVLKYLAALGLAYTAILAVAASSSSAELTPEVWFLLYLAFYGTLGVLPVIGGLIVLFDAQHRGYWDMLAGTKVARTRPHASA